MAEQPSRTARVVAMDLLARREHSRAELIKKLAIRGYSFEESDEALSRLAEQGLQSDSRFASAYLQSRANRGIGPVRIKIELQQRSVSEAIISVAFDNCEEDWSARAKAVVHKKFGEEPPSSWPEQAKQWQFLQYRGFDPDHFTE